MGLGLGPHGSGSGTDHAPSWWHSLGLRHSSSRRINAKNRECVLVSQAQKIAMRARDIFASQKLLIGLIGIP